MAHRVFISYHHANDQKYKETLVKWAEEYDIFKDWSVEIGDISDNLTDQQIREKIRNEYLRDSSVTILLVGTETKYRKHIDWEIYSSMYDGSVNKKSGIIVINLPTINCSYYNASHSGEKENVFPENTIWTTVSDRGEYERRYPYMPDRIIDNLLKSNAKVSVIGWDSLTVGKLKYMVEMAFADRANCSYDLSRSMKRKNA
ncbi:TIR domain-containing protein [Sphingobacterium kitahiroshimense]|uniref:TIR domain-containing protein n=1 Tax=Sphingobacterium kitahiroshimense TaxID=470446 RepID=UPI00320A97CF